MGLGPSKEQIFQILEESITNTVDEEKENLLIKCNFKEEKENKLENLEKKNENCNNSNESFDFSDNEDNYITSSQLDINNINKFPYNAIGTLIVKFPKREEEYLYTCFLIYENVVVTLAHNLEDFEKGGRAISIMTTFSRKKVKWENIYIQKFIRRNLSENDNDENLYSKLAIIIYNYKIGNEWVGIEEGNKEKFINRDLYTIFSTGYKVSKCIIKKDENGNQNLEENNKKIKNIKINLF